MENFDNFKKIHQDHISNDDLQILSDFYSCVIDGGKYDKMVAFIYNHKKPKYNLISDFIDIVGEINISEISSFKLYKKRPHLIVIPEACKGKNKKLNDNVTNLLFYEQPILYGGSFIKGVFNAHILDKTHVIYIQ